MGETSTRDKAGKAAAPASGAFEAGLERLEKIVAELERPEVSLEESVRLFEEGMALAEECRKQLDAAEGKIEMLVKRASGMTTEPFQLKDDRSPNGQ